MPAERPAIAKLTIVAPVYNESENLPAFFAALQTVLFAAPDLDVRVILVDDGSTDDSWSLIEAFAAAEQRCSGVRLSRNFGAHIALSAGFDHVARDSDMVSTLAVDLQDPPETVLAFVERWRQGADIVWGSRRQRADRTWRRLASGIVERILRNHAMPRQSKFRTGSFLLMDRVVLDCFLQYREHSRVTFALVAWTGFNQAVVDYDRAPRRAGQSGWSFGRLLSSAYDVFIGFSPMPARLLTMLGVGLFALSVAAIGLILGFWLVRDVQPGWTGLMVTITFFFGILFMMIGVIAEYLYRIFIESKNRPLYFVAQRAGQTDARTGNG